MQLIETDHRSSALTFDFTTCATVEGRTAIALHLFRDGASVLTRTIATVEHRCAVPVLLRCRADLERRGIAEQEDGVSLPLPVVRRSALSASAA